jgi:hypothetical protein
MFLFFIEFSVLLYFLLLAQKKVTKKRAANSMWKVFMCNTLLRIGGCESIYSSTGRKPYIFFSNFPPALYSPPLVIDNLNFVERRIRRHSMFL